MDQKKTKLLLLSATAASVLFAIGIFIFGVVYGNSSFAKAVLFVASFVLLLIGVDGGGTKTEFLLRVTSITRTRPKA